jgi:hypothetical protein
MFPILMRGKLAGSLKNCLQYPTEKAGAIWKLQELPESTRELANSHPLIIVNSEAQNCVLTDRPIVPIGL